MNMADTRTFEEGETPLTLGSTFVNDLRL